MERSLASAVMNGAEMVAYAGCLGE